MQTGSVDCPGTVTLLEWRTLLLPQLLLLAQQLHAVGFGSFRLAGALNGRGNLTIQKLVPQAQHHAGANRFDPRVD